MCKNTTGKTQQIDNYTKQFTDRRVPSRIWLRFNHTDADELDNDGLQNASFVFDAGRNIIEAACLNPPVGV